MLSLLPNNMKKEETIELYNILRPALAGLDGSFIRRILRDLPHEELKANGPDAAWRVNYRGIKFIIIFNDQAWTSRIPEIAFIMPEDSDPEFVLIESGRTLDDEETVAFGNYKYSLSDIASMFDSEPFYLNHLTKSDIEWYAKAVQEEMTDWDEWVKTGDVSEDKRDEHLSSIEEKILTQIAPYEDGLKTLDDVVKLFARKRTARQPLMEAVRQVKASLDELMEKPYWIFRSPAPSSTESAAIKKLKKARELLEEAELLIKSLH